MFKHVSNAILSLVLDKDARNALENRQKKSRMSERDRQIAELRQNVQKVMTPERQELIRKAMEVHRAKSKIIGDLQDKDKQKLYALAVKQLLREGGGGGGTP